MGISIERIKRGNPQQNGQHQRHASHVEEGRQPSRRRRTSCSSKPSSIASFKSTTMITVTHCGRICIGRRKINLSVVFAGLNVGIKEVSQHILLVTFMHYDLGLFDDE
jgi:hypothetical protein